MSNTPLQQLRDKINEHVKTMVGKQPYDNGYKSALVDVMYLIDEFKEEEKQAILEAYNQGYRDGDDDNGIDLFTGRDISKISDAEIYYNNTYNKKDDKEIQGDSIQ